jgi:putative transposase
MTRDRRAKVAGATYFFTVNCAERHGNRLLTNNIEVLRQIFRQVEGGHPFAIDAIVILPEHLHGLWSLPPGEADYKTRWTLIKAGFSRAIPPSERRSTSRMSRGERGLWQHRYWEYRIRNDRDFEYIDYIHWNPVKQGGVKCVGG